MDWTTLAVAGMSLVGTLAGTFGGILVSSKLVNYRIEQLEKKQDQVNNVIERTYKLEGQMVEVQHDIRDLKAEVMEDGAAVQAPGQSVEHQEPGHSGAYSGIRLPDLFRRRHRGPIPHGVHRGHCVLLRHPGGEKRQQKRRLIHRNRPF